MAFIRFQLSQLSARNAQHEFEILALEIAKLRIASNLIPATGPVQAGGDQGRDFESYRTYLASTSLRSSTFTGMASQELIVGACTLNKKAISKIKSDLKSIFGSGSKPTHIVYFCEIDVPVARRHNLQKLCSESYGAQLDIFDGQAIAGLLANPDTFWIAERYLSVPSELWPEEVGDARYNELKTRWLNSEASPQTYADFLEIKLGLRIATFEEYARPDLSAWIARMKTFAGIAFADRLIRKANYEISVAELRGHGSLDPAADHIENFFASVSHDIAPAELMDAAVLVVYMRGAVARGHTTLSREKITAWGELVKRAVNTSLKTATTGGARCFLLTARAMLETLPSHDDHGSEVAKTRYLGHWRALVKEIKKTPYYSTRDVARILEQLAPIFGSLPLFRELTRDVDKLVSERAGAAAAADLARGRAVAHFEVEQYAEAINELQEAKIGWFTGETIDGSILAMLLISEAYERLHLHFAARYYAAGALFVALKHEDEAIKKRVPQAEVKLANTYYAAGEGLTFLHSAARALQSHEAVSADAFDWSRYPDAQHVAAHAAILRAVLKRIAPDLVPFADEAIGQFPFSEDERAKFIELSEGEPWRSIPTEEIQQRINEDLGQTPFNDLGKQRSVTWAALGIVWTVQSGSDRESWLAAAEVIATLQIAQVDFSDADLLIIPSQVLIEIAVGDIQKPKTEQLPDNGRLTWNITMPKTSSDDYNEAVAAVAIMVLAQSTALTDAGLQSLVLARMKRGLSNRLFSVRPARELLHFAQPELPKFGDLAALQRPALDVQPKEAPQLAWRTDLGPGYSRARATTFLHNRYRISSQAIQFTLPRLLNDQRCRSVIRELRREGLLDWQILNVISGMVANYELNRSAGKLSFDQMRKQLFDRLHRVERDDDPPYDLEAFTLETARMAHKISTAAAMQTWGLANHRKTPDFDAIKRLLDVRYLHSTDDISHDDPFPGL